MYHNRPRDSVAGFVHRHSAPLAIVSVRARVCTGDVSWIMPVGHEITFGDTF